MISKQKTSVIGDRPNLTELERCILNLLCSYLMQAKDNNPESSQIQQILKQFKQALAREGVVDEQVQFKAQQSEPLLHRFEHQIAKTMHNGNVLFSCLPLQIEQAGGKLIIYLIRDPMGENYLWMVEEQEIPSFSITALELLGLTKREAEVLFWIAKDKSNAGIAKVLGCCEGTVRKHLEHLYEKLGVQTRTGAVTVALERLGLLKW